MHFKADTAALVKALSIASKGIPGRTRTLDVLMGIMIVAEKGQVFLRTTDLEVYCSIPVTDAEVNTEGRILVSGADFTQLVKSGTGSLTISRIGKPKGQRLVIESSAATQKLTAMDEAEFPVFPKESPKVVLEFTKEFADVIPMLVASAATDVSRPMLTGAHIMWKGSAITMDSSDGFRLTRWTTTSTTESEGEGGVIIPRKTLTMLPLIFGDKLTMSVNEAGGRVYFTGSGGTIASLTIDQKFPQVDAIIPKESKTMVSVSGSDAYEAWRRAGATSEMLLTVLDTESGTVTAKSNRSETEAKLPMKVEGDHIGIAVNSEYMVGALASLKDVSVTIGLNMPKNPLVLRSEEWPGLIHVIMPMHMPKRE